MADLSKIAKSFGMNVNELCEFTGYTRQALHQTLDGNNGIYGSRMHAVLKLLQYKSRDIFAEEMTAAETASREREKMIQDIAKKCGLILEVQNVKKNAG